MSIPTILESKIFIPEKMLISAKDYQHMGAAGIFMDKPRVELLDGEIYTMSPITPDHNSHVDKASQFFTVKLFGKISLVRVGFKNFNSSVSVLRTWLMA